MYVEKGGSIPARAFKRRTVSQRIITTSNAYVEEAPCGLGVFKLSKNLLSNVFLSARPTSLAKLQFRADIIITYANTFILANSPNNSAVFSSPSKSYLIMLVQPCITYESSQSRRHGSGGPRWKLDGNLVRVDWRGISQITNTVLRERDRIDDKLKEGLKYASIFYTNYMNGRR